MFSGFFNNKYFLRMLEDKFLNFFWRWKSGRFLWSLPSLVLCRNILARIPLSNNLIVFHWLMIEHCIVWPKEDPKELLLRKSYHFDWQITIPSSQSYPKTSGWKYSSHYHLPTFWIFDWFQTNSTPWRSIKLISIIDKLSSLNQQR